MKNLSFAFLLLLFCYNAVAQTAGAINIIPQPVKTIQKTGNFSLPAHIVIEAPQTIEMQQTLQFLSQKLTTTTGATIEIKDKAPQATIKLVVNTVANKEIGNEGYQLSVNPSTIVISANTAAGLFYGAQSLIQLFPAAIEGTVLVKNVSWMAPCAEITDYPRFEWRGLMFDVSRHFFTKAEVKDFIDLMARYKFNILHWHLTDDEGWRIEIKSFPKLTQVGAWNVKKEGYFGTFTAPKPDAPRNYGGFYTQEDIKEVVAYAKARFVNIVPEVDVPGHSLAAIASYPELSCTPGAEKYKVRSGEEIMDWSHGAPPIALVDNTLCPANEKVYDFLDKVMTEVAALFPFDYIHVGGDECPKNFWEKSEAIKDLMQKEGLKNMQEVQSYFEKRLETIVESKGKKFLGWDEILEGGLAPNAAVMSWRGEKGGIEASNLHHDVIMTPSPYTYVDFMQSDRVTEPHVYATLRLNKAYQFEPVPKGADAKYIKGGQANLWTEQIYNTRHLQYMLWPRAFATSESVWSQKENKNWNSFITRVEAQFKRFNEQDIKYAPSMYDPIFTPKNDGKGNLTISLATEIDDLDIYYSFDNSFPDRFYPKYTKTLTVPEDAVMLKVITYRGKEPKGRMIYMPIKELKRRADGKAPGEEE